MTDIQAGDQQTTDALEDADDASKDAQGDAGEVRKRKTLKGGLDPSEMARRRWAKERARENDEQAQAVHEARGHAVVVRTTVQVGSIIKALAKAAEKGGVSEARELRSYLADFPVETDTDVSALDRRTRQALMAMLLDDRVLAAYEDGRMEAWIASL